jgi:hypothetical protein
VVNLADAGLTGRGLAVVGPDAARAQAGHRGEALSGKPFPDDERSMIGDDRQNEEHGTAEMLAEDKLVGDRAGTHRVGPPVIVSEVVRMGTAPRRAIDGAEAVD